MWDIVKYVLILGLIGYGVFFYFGEHKEKRMLQQYQQAVKKFEAEQNRFPRSFRELETTRRQDGYPYVEANTQRDNPPRNGEWAVDEDKGVVYVRRYKVDQNGRVIKDDEGNPKYTREYLLDK
ncbi:MAG TPA: hypothetical protein PKM88_06935 [bacterium]|nr:hypothetical protein [bacterium]